MEDKIKSSLNRLSKADLVTLPEFKAAQAGSKRDTFIKSKLPLNPEEKLKKHPTLSRFNQGKSEAKTISVTNIQTFGSSKTVGGKKKESSPSLCRQKLPAFRRKKNRNAQSMTSFHNSKVMLNQKSRKEHTHEKSHVPTARESLPALSGVFSTRAERGPIRLSLK